MTESNNANSPVYTTLTMGLVSSSLSIIVAILAVFSTVLSLFIGYNYESVNSYVAQLLGIGGIFFLIGTFFFLKNYLKMFEMENVRSAISILIIVFIISIPVSIVQLVMPILISQTGIVGMASFLGGMGFVSLIIRCIVYCILSYTGYQLISFKTDRAGGLKTLGICCLFYVSLDIFITVVRIALGFFNLEIIQLLMFYKLTAIAASIIYLLLPVSICWVFVRGRKYIKSEFR